MSKDEISEMADQIDQFTVSWNSFSHKHLPYEAMKELRNFLIDYFTEEEEE